MFVDVLCIFLFSFLMFSLEGAEGKRGKLKNSVQKTQGVSVFMAMAVRIYSVLGIATNWLFTQNKRNKIYDCFKIV